MSSLLRRAALLGLVFAVLVNPGCSGKDPNETNPDLKTPNIPPGRSKTDKATPPPPKK
jgi:hypothetical protein